MLKKLTAIIFILASNYIFVPAVLAQKFSDGIGAMTTFFDFTSNGKERIIHDQIILKRGNRTLFLTHDNGAGLGYESFHLELTVDKKFESVVSEEKKTRNHWELIFYKKKGEVLSIIHIPEDQVKYLSNPDNSMSFYSIDLTDVPIVIFNRTSSIDIKHLRKE
ncbi:hypothetical protein [Algoriphagus sp. PAP.12]|uniref:hypothetical protein n=1 Tax=Algoriphagus sp. PAP.12 TaxID=2996678 RepID=UPI00227A7E25|nr:hypothetical protein [Algoriphagus sp. PAP.12]